MKKLFVLALTLGVLSVGVVSASGSSESSRSSSSSTQSKPVSQPTPAPTPAPVPVKTATPAITVTKVTGTATVVVNGSTVPAVPGQTLPADATITTGFRSSVQVKVGPSILQTGSLTQTTPTGLVVASGQTMTDMLLKVGKVDPSVNQNTSVPTTPYVPQSPTGSSGVRG